MKILLPVDGSECTQRMVAYLAAHDELFGQRHEYVMLFAIDHLPSHVASLLDPRAIDEYCNRAVDSVFAPLRAFADQNRWAARFEAINGEAGVTIADYARQQQVDLIVMGSHGRTALANVVAGSVATSVLARCKIPVLLIR
jgi:nucleotide-binding universal stress UspA family protein